MLFWGNKIIKYVYLKKNLKYYVGTFVLIP
jgi:hypothetical protein